MGQRFQCYIIGDKKRVGYHNQWSYGTLPIKALYRLIKFDKETDQYNKLKTVIDGNSFGADTTLIENLLSCDYQSGYYHKYHDITGECSNNPELGDNNDGFLTLDLRGKMPKYCFMFLEYSDGNNKPHRPLSAREYLARKTRRN